MSAAPPAAAEGLPLEALAARLALTPEQAKELLRPFLAAGLIARRGGALAIADPDVAAAFGGGPGEP